MNSYGSSIRTFTARNVLETVMPLSPAALTIAVNDWVPQIFETGQRTGTGGTSQIIQASNLILRRIGLFCNFADGLIFRTPYANPVITITAVPYSVSATPFTGTVNVLATSKSVDGVGTQFITEGLVAGSVIRIGGRLYTLAANPSAETGLGCLTLTDYAHTANNASVYQVNVNAQVWSGAFRWINNLNYMYERESFSAISLLAGNLSNYFLRASVSQAASADYMTNTVDTSFEDAPVIFDVVADFEITATGNN